VIARTRLSTIAFKPSSAFKSLNNRFHRRTNFTLDPFHVPAARSVSAKPIPPDSTFDIITESPELFCHGPAVIPQASTSHIPETRRPLHFDIPCALPEPVKESSVETSNDPIEPVYFGLDYKTFVSAAFPPRFPDDLEIEFRGTRTNQFPWINEEYENGANTLSTISPKHDSKNDPTLLPSSVKKRLRMRKNSSAYELSSHDELLGNFLYGSLCEAYHRDPNQIIPFDTDLFASCISLNEYAQLTSKTKAIIQANANRSDPDWRWTVVRIFSKTQHKINENSIFGNWKACQTLALMHDAVILLFGPVKKYQRVFDAKDRPPNLFVYGGQTPFDMSVFAQKFIPKGALKVTNDYTSFDQSQGGESVVVERKKMERLQIPPYLIELHCYIKTNLECQFGHLTCMRLTGEPGTYDDNTDYNTAVLYSQYKISSQAVLVSGDDSFISPPPPKNPLWAAVEPLLTLTFKTESSRYGLFCGYYLSAYGAVRAPRALLVKLVLALDNSSLQEKLSSYLSEFVVGHSLGDALWQSLPPSQILWQAALFDFFCRHCSKEQKITMKIGEVPTNLVREMLALGFSWISKPLYALLDRASRFRLLKRSRSFVPLADPQLESVLQPLL